MEKGKEIEERMQSPVRVDLLAPQSTDGQQRMNYQQEQELHQGMQAIQLRRQDCKVLWVGRLKSWMDAVYLCSCFVETGHDCTVRVHQRKRTPYSDGYGFVEFKSHEAAREILQMYNGKRIMPQTGQRFTMYWALGEGPKHAGIGAKLVKGSITKRSKGNSYVSFGNETERGLAMTQMNGIYCSRFQQPQACGVSSAAPALATDNDPNDSTIFVGGLDLSVTDDDLRAVFSEFGDIVHVKIEGCGFVQFNHRASAVEALQALQGKAIGQQAIQLAWFRSLYSKQVPQHSPACGGQPQDPNHGNGEYFAYEQGYKGYESAQRSHDPGKGYTHGNYPEDGKFYQQQSGRQAGTLPAPTNFVSQDSPGGWGQAQDPNVWNGGCYGDQQGLYRESGYAQRWQGHGAYTHSSHPGYGYDGEHRKIRAGTPRAHTHHNHLRFGNYGQQSESLSRIPPALMTNSAVKQEEEHYQPQEPNQWNGGNQQGSHDGDGYAQLSEDPGAYTSGSHPSYGNYGQHSQAGLAPASITNSAVEQEEKPFDPSTLPDTLDLF